LHSGEVAAVGAEESATAASIEALDPTGGPGGGGVVCGGLEEHPANAITHTVIHVGSPMPRGYARAGAPHGQS
jgi:hypothetical protein